MSAPLLELNIFAKNQSPFAWYFDHDAFVDLELHINDVNRRSREKRQRKREATNADNNSLGTMPNRRPYVYGPKLATYRRIIPRTVAVAEALMDTTCLHKIWAVQHEHISWRTVTEGNRVEVVPAVYDIDHNGEIVKDSNGDPIIIKLAILAFQNKLRLVDVIKHLCGRSYSLGITDRSVLLDIGWNPETNEFDELFNGIKSLKIDTDMDRAFNTMDQNAILSELKNQRRIANLIGYPYNAFKTGSRGFQAIIPIPGCVFISAASWITIAFRMLAEATKHNGAKIDADSSYSIMRLPGGIHLKTGDLGLWIDIDAGELYTVDEQARHMRDAYSYSCAVKDSSDVEPWKNGEFDAAVQDLIIWLESHGHKPETRLREHTPLFHAALASLPNNPIVARFIAAAKVIAPHILEPETIRLRQNKSDQVNRPDGIDQDGYSKIDMDDLIYDDESTDHQTKSSTRRSNSTNKISMTKPDALEIWTRGYQIGGSRLWHLNGHQDGHGWGMLAAVVLFGKDRALNELLNKARSVAYVDENHLQKRLDYIVGLWDDFEMKDWTAYNSSDDQTKLDHKALSVSQLSPELLDLRDWIVEQAVLARSMSKPTRSRLSMVIEVILALVDSSPDGTIQISFRSISAAINERYPTAKSIDKSTVAELMSRIVEGEPNAIGIIRKNLDVHCFGRISANCYSKGSLLSTTKFGKVISRRIIARMTLSQDEVDQWEKGERTGVGYGGESDSTGTESKFDDGGDGGSNGNQSNLGGGGGGVEVDCSTLTASGCASSGKWTPTLQGSLRCPYINLMYKPIVDS